MKKLNVLVVCGVLAVTCSVMAADNKPTTGGKPPGNASPQTSTIPRPKMLWDYQKELELSDNQMKGIKKAVNDFEQDLAQKRVKLQSVETELQSLIDQKGDVNQIKTKLNESASLQVEIRLSEILTARKIDSMLSATQLRMWKEIRAKEMAKRGAPAPKSP